MKSPNSSIAHHRDAGGQGTGLPLDKIIALHADMWAFAAHWTGLEVDQAEGDQIDF